jgi:hypothetical protein
MRRTSHSQASRTLYPRLLAATTALLCASACSVRLNNIETTQFSLEDTPSDTAAPTSPALSINSGATDTHFLGVTLNMAATESVSTPLQACVSANADCSGCAYGAVSFGSSVSYALTGAAGAKAVSAKYRDAAGNETACVSASINYTQAPLAVTHRFSNARHWNDYARRCPTGNNLCSGMAAETAAACTGTETGGANACIHGGERRRVATVETSCTGLTMTDSLGAFDWSCEVVGGFATFYSRLKPSKGLADLVTHGSPTGSWKTNAVTLSKGAESVASAASAWWNTTNNPVHELPDNSTTCPNPGADPAWTCDTFSVNDETAILAAAGTVYTLDSSRSTNGYSINADKISLVTIGSGAILSGGVSSGNCSTSTMEYDAASLGRCLISIGNQKFVWMEGMYLGESTGQPDYVIATRDVSFSQFRRISAGVAGANNLLLTAGTSNNRFSQLRSSNSDSAGISAVLTSAGKIAGNLFWDLNLAASGGDGLLLKSDVDYNVIANVVVNNNDSMAIHLRGDANQGDDTDAKKNVLTRVTATNNREGGIKLWTDGASLPDNLLHNALIAGNGNNSYAVLLERSGNDVLRPTLSQLAVSRNVNTLGAIRFDGVSGGKVTGNLLVGNNTANNCSVNGGTDPGLSAFAECAAAGSSDHNLVTGLDVDGSFVYKATSDSSNSAENGSGISTGTNILANPADLFTFDNFFRSWAISNGAVWPHATLNSRCFLDGSNCQMLDWSLLAAASAVRNVTGNGSTANGAVTGGACPTEANGTHYLTAASYAYDSGYFSGLNGVEISGGDADGICESGETCAQRYLANASELFDDERGDEDGLCETDEGCVYTPNFGAYQGHGALTSCTFTDGAITGVSMSYYPTNGY